LDLWLAEKLEEREGESLPAYRDLSEDLERRLIRQLLRRHGGKLARLADEMKANRSTLRKKLRKR
jgi:DNA-binding NtrC family response regulator